jgi:hypothetical protein
MAVPYIGQLKARLEARFHVQIEITFREADFATPAEVPITGRVVSVFRGAISVGDEITFSVHVTRPEDDWDMRLIGPTYMLYETFMRASYIEAFLNGDPPICELALDEYVVLDNPTPLPQLRSSRVEYLAELAKWKLGYF